MGFTVKQQHGRFDVLSAEGMILDSYDTQAAAQVEADRMNAEYERVLAIL